MSSVSQQIHNIYRISNDRGLFHNPPHVRVNITVDSSGTMEITVAAAATILAAYAAFHYVTTNILQNHCNICRRSNISSACDVYLMLSHVRSTKHQFPQAAASLLSLRYVRQSKRAGRPSTSADLLLIRARLARADSNRDRQSKGCMNEYFAGKLLLASKMWESITL